MKAGDTFFIGPLGGGNRPHLRVVISDPEQDPDHILVVNFTTSKYFPDDSCVVQAGVHPCIDHESCINYFDAFDGSNSLLESCCDTGKFHMRTPVSKELLEKIRQGAKGSDLPMKYVKLLEKQGLIK